MPAATDTPPLRHEELYVLRARRAEDAAAVLRAEVARLGGENRLLREAGHRAVLAVELLRAALGDILSAVAATGTSGEVCQAGDFSAARKALSVSAACLPCAATGGRVVAEE